MTESGKLTTSQVHAVTEGDDVTCPECGHPHLTTDNLDGATYITCPQCPYLQEVETQ